MYRTVFDLVVKMVLMFMTTELRRTTHTTHMLALCSSCMHNTRDRKRKRKCSELIWFIMMMQKIPVLVNEKKDKRMKNATQTLTMQHSIEKAMLCPGISTGGTFFFHFDSSFIFCVSIFLLLFTNPPPPCHSRRCFASAWPT